MERQHSLLPHLHPFRPLATQHQAVVKRHQYTLLPLVKRLLPLVTYWDHPHLHHHRRLPLLLPRLLLHRPPLLPVQLSDRKTATSMTTLQMTLAMIMTMTNRPFDIVTTEFSCGGCSSVTSACLLWTTRSLASRPQTRSEPAVIYCNSLLSSPVSSLLYFCEVVL